MKVFTSTFTPAELTTLPNLVIDGTNHALTLSVEPTPAARAQDYATQILALTQTGGVKIAAAASDGVVFLAVIAATSVTINNDATLLRTADVAIADYTPPETGPVLTTRTTAALGGVLVGLLLAS